MTKQGVVDELHRRVRKKFQRRSYIMRGINDTFQADLIEMIPHAKINSNFRYILTVIDTFSKYAWGIPLKNKTGDEVTVAMQKIFNKDNRIPKNIHTDAGKEFYNQSFQKLMKKYKINHYSTFSSMKASIVERFNRTLMTKIWKIFSFNGSYKWIKCLQDVIDLYNNTIHRTIKIKPCEVTPQNAENILKTRYKENNSLNTAHINKYKINDFVRISKYKSLFEKGYTPNWSTEIFQVHKILPTNPKTYLLKDSTDQIISGSFYEFELMKTKYPNIHLIEKVLRRKGNKMLVKWLGFDISHNSWIHKKDFV